jgi:hypothetical protein
MAPDQIQLSSLAYPIGDITPLLREWRNSKPIYAAINPIVLRFNFSAEGRNSILNIYMAVKIFGWF